MNIIVGNAWPYANGPLHLGRIAVWLPGDIIARYHRLMGDKVVFLSGTDCHGTPVTTRAKDEEATPLEIVNKYHEEFKRCFSSLGFSFDIFSKTHSKYHEEKVKEFILELYNKGYIYDKEGQLYFKLSDFEEDVRNIYINENCWRQNAKDILKRYLDGGLRDREVTRDFNWGVDVPLKGYEDKKIYVWIEAVMGYLTASMECLEERNEQWKEYWEGEDSRIYLVHGKDNIPFHTMIFPAILIGVGIKDPNIRIVSSEYLKLEGKPFSTIKNWALWADYISNNYSVDSFRYYLTLNSPENSDTDFTWREYINVHNNDLCGNLSLFVNKVLSFSKKNYGNRIPTAQLDENIKNQILDLYFSIGDNIEEGNFKEALNILMDFCKKSNKYFDERKMWGLLEKDAIKCRAITYNAIQIVANLANLLHPFMPHISDKIKISLSMDTLIWSFIEKKSGIIKDLDILFQKIDKRKAIEEVSRLKKERI